MGSADEQDSYLCGLISVLPVARHRNRKPADEARVDEAKYKYRLRGKVDNIVEEFDVSKKVFLSIPGIGKRRVERLTKSLKETGFSPKNMRGVYDNRPHKINDDVLDKICNHIKSFPSRNNHYGLKYYESNLIKISI